jgi:AcrR family transcriptional regulator
MWISKNADERRTEILDSATKLFAEKGYDSTSVTDIMNEVGIAKGTLYYHFKSKEEILDGIIERIKETLISNAKLVLENKSLNLYQKISKALLSLQVQESSGKEIFSEVHKPQNALMEQKILKEMIKDVTPVLSELIEEGNKEKVFNCEYPYESAELFITYGNIVFDSNYVQMTPEQMFIRINAFIKNMEKVLGAKDGSLEFIKKMWIN